MSGVKKRLDDKRKTTISLTDANHIASCLNCTLQEFGGKYYHPIIVDYRKRAERNLSAIPEEDIVWVCDLLADIGVFSDEKKRILWALRDWIKSTSDETYNIYGSLWWVCVYFKELRDAVLQSNCKLSSRPEAQTGSVRIRPEDEFHNIYQTQKREYHKSNEQAADEICKAIMRNGEKILDLIQSRADIQEAACKRCANYLISAFTYMEPEMSNKITLYKKGVL